MELTGDLRNAARRLTRGLRKRVDGAKADLQWHASALQNRVVRITDRRKSRIAQLGGRLHALSPLATLNRGYALARAEDGRPLTSIDAFEPDMAFSVVLKDGTVGARATEVKAADPALRAG